MSVMRKRRAPREDFRRGQVWELADSNLQIGLVGKTLVHYRLFKGKNRRAPVSIAARKVLERYLIAHKAILIRDYPEAQNRLAG